MSVLSASAKFPVIELAHISRVYPSADKPVYAVRDVDLVVRRGEFVAIMGASGSGKSTLMNLLGCVDRPTSGSYRLDGVDVATLDEDDLAAVRNRRIGFVFQGFNLLARSSAIENVELPLLYSFPAQRRRESRDRAETLLRRVGLGERINHRPPQLSGGQQQRVAIARALASDPSLLLADEPTGNLDTSTSIEIMNVLRELHSGGATIVLVTHEPDIAACAERIVRMRDGRIVEDAPNAPRKASEP